MARQQGGRLLSGRKPTLNDVELIACESQQSGLLKLRGHSRVVNLKLCLAGFPQTAPAAFNCLDTSPAKAE